MIRDSLGLSFDDVLLYPQKGEVASRSEVDLTTNLTRSIDLELPIISAPMSSVTGVKMAVAMDRCGGYGILHRADSIEEQCAKIGQISHGLTGCAIGVNEGYERFEALYHHGCRVFCVDIAHAHCKVMEAFIKGIPERVERDSINLIVGNVATASGARFLLELGVDAIKVGIGPGAACTTRTVTGFGVPQLSAIMEVREEIEDMVPIIADGGIKNSGDAAKALAAGASTVMLGRLLAGAEESPSPGKYWGMASHRENGHNAPEGLEGDVELTGPVENTLKQMEWALKSAVSYGGARDLDEFRRYAEFIKVSPMVQNETGVRF